VSFQRLWKSTVGLEVVSSARSFDSRAPRRASTRSSRARRGPARGWRGAPPCPRRRAIPRPVVPIFASPLAARAPVQRHVVRQDERARPRCEAARARSGPAPRALDSLQDRLGLDEHAVADEAQLSRGACAPRGTGARCLLAAITSAVPALCPPWSAPRPNMVGEQSTNLPLPLAPTAWADHHDVHCHLVAFHRDDRQRPPWIRACGRSPLPGERRARAGPRYGFRRPAQGATSTSSSVSSTHALEFRRAPVAPTARRCPKVPW